LSFHDRPIVDGNFNRVQPQAFSPSPLSSIASMGSSNNNGGGGGGDGSGGGAGAGGSSAPTSSHALNVSNTDNNEVNGDSDVADNPTLLNCGQRCCFPCMYGDHPSAGKGEGKLAIIGRWVGFFISLPYIWAFTNTIPPSFRAATAAERANTVTLSPQEPTRVGIARESVIGGGNVQRNNGSTKSTPPIVIDKAEDAEGEDAPQALHYYKTAFVMCIIWIMVLSFVMVLFVIRLGCMIGVDDYVMGLVIVAAGTSAFAFLCFFCCLYVSVFPPPPPPPSHNHYHHHHTLTVASYFHV
jgi:hypothetical protein